MSETGYDPMKDIGLVVKLVRETTGLRPGTPEYEDALQDCLLLLFRQVRPHWIPARGAWSNYATWCLRRFLWRRTEVAVRLGFTRTSDSRRLGPNRRPPPERVELERLDPDGREQPADEIAARREVAARVRRVVANIRDRRLRAVARGWLAGEVMDVTARSLGITKQHVANLRAEIVPRLQLALFSCL